MNRLFLLATIVTAGVVSAQDSSTTDETVTESAAETSAEIIEGINNEDLDSQENHTEEDADVFKPTDIVSYSQSVPFPTDI